eukprot:3891392-Prorocentrum_lima.AAC.1
MQYKYFAQWEQSHDRVYYGAGKGRGRGDAPWRAACLAESSTSKGLASLSVTVDMSAFYDHIRLEKLWHAALCCGFPQWLLR